MPLRFHGNFSKFSPTFEGLRKTTTPDCVVWIRGFGRIRRKTAKPDATITFVEKLFSKYVLTESPQ